MDFDTFMIVYSVDSPDGPRHGIYMYDEETIKTFPSKSTAEDKARELRQFMQNCSIGCATRIVLVV